MDSSKLLLAMGSPSLELQTPLLRVSRQWQVFLVAGSYQQSVIFPFSLSDRDTEQCCLPKSRSFLAGRGKAQLAESTWDSPGVCLKVRLPRETSPDGGRGVLVPPHRQHLVSLDSW